jgi:hypothetical protein
MRRRMKKIIKASIGLGVVAASIFYATKKTGILANDAALYDEYDTSK